MVELREAGWRAVAVSRHKALLVCVIMFRSDGLENMRSGAGPTAGYALIRQGAGFAAVASAARQSRMLVFCVLMLALVCELHTTALYPFPPLPNKWS